MSNNDKSIDFNFWQFKNIPLISFIFEVSKFPKFICSNNVQPENIFDTEVTCDVSKLEKSIDIMCDFNVSSKLHS